MPIKGWTYYNHAAIPTVAPHEMPDLQPVENGQIWSIDGRTPLLARWTTEFDCGYETNWWYLIRKAPYDIEELGAKERKSIRQALKKSYVKKLSLEEHLEQMYQCYLAAHSQYENAGDVPTQEAYRKLFRDHVECWGAFEPETEQLIGYLTVGVYDTYGEIETAKFDPKYFKLQASDALYYTVLDHYLNQRQVSYISSGSRNINHKTGTQEYKIRRFGYQKAYCQLHVQYNPKIKKAVDLLYIFRKPLMWLDKITFIHKINAVLLMETLVREKK